MSIKNKQPFRLNPNKQVGFGLVEVLVSFLILSIGILGVIALQIKGVQLNQGALYQSKSAILAGDIMDKVRANFGAVPEYLINLEDSAPADPGCEDPAADCSPAELAAHDVFKWREALESVLPEGTGSVEMDNVANQTLITVTIQYEDSRPEGATAFGLNNNIPPKQFIFRTTVPTYL